MASTVQITLNCYKKIMKRRYSQILTITGQGDFVFSKFSAVVVY